MKNVDELREFDCECSPNSKIPDALIPFYIDQRTSRQFLVSSIELNESVNESLATELSTITISDSDYTPNAHIHDEALHNSQNVTSICDNSTTVTPMRLPSPTFHDDPTNDPDFELSSKDLAAVNAENVSKIDLTEVANICDAKQVSSRAAACIVSATLRAQAKAEKKENPSNIPVPIFTPAVFRSALNRVRLKALADNNAAASNMICFQFDGKICDTMVTRNDAAGRRNVLEKIEYIVVVKQPGDNFVASVPATTGSSADEIFKSIRDHFESNNIVLQNVVAIGCDGAPVNTGVENGIIRRFEELLGRPVQWIICILHLNELVFHRLFKLLDSSSCSPQGYSSDLGQQLLICETLKPVKFKRIGLDINELPKNIDQWNLTNDQKYLLDMAKAVSAGYLSEKLYKQKPGKMHKARWVTTMSRILSVCVSSKLPACSSNTGAIHYENLHSSSVSNKRQAIIRAWKPALIFTYFVKSEIFRQERIYGSLQRNKKYHQQ